MVEVCLMLAPDENFFLNSRKQGLPCWRSLLFFLFSFSSGHMVQAPGKPLPSN